MDISVLWRVLFLVGVSDEISQHGTEEYLFLFQNNGLELVEETMHRRTVEGRIDQSLELGMGMDLGIHSYQEK